MQNPKSNYRGVGWHPFRQKWTAECSVNGKRTNLGVFETEEEAYAAYLKATEFRRKEIPEVVNLSGEEWNPIPGYDGYYASNMGRIKTLNFNKTGLEALIKPVDPGNGYRRVYLKGKPRSIHRLVWASFNGPISNKMVVNHKDLNPSNNKLDNLEVVTYRENTHHHFKARGIDVTGVIQRPNNKRWMARICVNGHYKALGDYDTKEEAEAVYWKAVDDLG